MPQAPQLRHGPDGALLGFEPGALDDLLPWLVSGAVPRLMASFETAGHQILGVGGCVRNAALGLESTDIDLSTDATPGEATRIAEAAGFRVVPTGVEHGTVTVVLGGTHVEVTTFRRDVETDGRRAVVAFSTDVAEDARRRDFTMNALYVRRDGRIIDPLGGAPDLLARRVRFIGVAEERIREDYLRILRFFRFHAQVASWEDGIDPDGLAACAAFADGLAEISRERIGAETRKLVMGPNAAPSLGAMAQSGVLMQVLPGAEIATFAHLVAAEGPTALPNTRLAALWVPDMADLLRLSKADARMIERLREAALSDQGAAEIGYRLGAEQGGQALLLRAALMAVPPSQPDLQAATDGAAQVFPIKAADLMDRFEGPALGAALSRLESDWIASRFTLSKEALLSRC